MNKVRINIIAAALISLIASVAGAERWHDGTLSREKVSPPAVPAATPVEPADRAAGRVLSTSYSLTGGEVAYSGEIRPVFR